MHLPDELAHIFTTGRPIYALSPHIDDAIWSTGSLLQALAKAGHDITLVSIFTHTIYVYDAVRPPAEATTIRKGEDYNAARAAGLRRVISLDFPDGILRDTPQASVINPGYETPAYLLKMVTDCLQQIVPEQAVILTPAAFGGHMDHLTTRRAAVALPQTKLLYRDMPYGCRQENSEEALHFLATGWQHSSLPLTPQQLDQHLQLFWHYQSQTSQAVADEIRVQLASHGLELWYSR